MITKKCIEEINFATKIEEVVGDFVVLKKQGQSYVGICPFHNDRNPSMHVTPRLGIYKCFVCDAKGNAINFLMEHAKMTYPEALEYLAGKYNIPIEYDRPETAEEKQARNEKESLFLVNEFAEKYFMQQLWESEEGKLMGMTYFKERGFKDATIKQFHLGYCPSGWDSFTKEALKQGFREEFLLKLGLTKKSENGKLYDFYRGRVIFPIHNPLGKVIGFGGRVLQKKDKVAKYINSPENEIYHKKETLYDIYLAKPKIRNLKNVYLVEGYTDVISMFESGVENVVASSGTALTPEQVKLISSQTQDITVMYDGDMAGIKASLRGIDILLEQGLNVKVCLLPDGEDPDSFAKAHRDSELQEYLTNNTTDFLLFKARILSQDAGNDPMLRARMVSEMVDSIAKMKDYIAQTFYIKECARIFDLPETTLNAELKRKVWKQNLEGSRRQQAENARRQQPAAETPTNTPPVGQAASTPYGTPPQDLFLPEPTIESKPPRNLLVNLVYEAEKNLVVVLLKYGHFEIQIETDSTSGEVVAKRIDQYIFDELYAEGLILQDPLLRKIYEHYADLAEKIDNQDDIIKTFLMSTDSTEQTFALDNIASDEPTYSEKWESRFDMYTHSLVNSAFALQQEVQNVLLTYKLRLLEQQLGFLQKELSQPDYTEDDIMGIMHKINLLNQCKSEIASRLNIVISK